MRIVLLLYRYYSRGIFTKTRVIEITILVVLAGLLFYLTAHIECAQSMSKVMYKVGRSVSRLKYHNWRGLD